VSTDEAAESSTVAVPALHAGAAARVWHGMRHLVLERYDRRRDMCEALGMSFIRAKALRLLAGGPMTMHELAARLPADAPYTTLIVGDLERRGMVTRTVHPTDRRSRIVAATPVGVQAAERAEQILAEPPAAMRSLNAADLAALDRIVAKLQVYGQP